jgi:hypothetical protein
MAESLLLSEHAAISNVEHTTNLAQPKTPV